ncbi:cysteine--1-D-myo-inosityl 2-amino-2-deoxy-alpha-D-glucopyranoside ligase [Arthrobacter sp. STN4]|uniref:cysteine--1-D-myo-inosityl 2-amino-2-deoxy-alpha-D-glucopyranoside ligase n=1 Tax=Arthrobacter sp. STN4 TaxID=2923276 RepID=UPI002119F5C2|nr:cysteine--1-D-myo-inosityl 2-amino-2-deoxy-alpha-D-glucopyranoside ligase [Arthrobacter sp. STN4]MCQ9165783.1 cysteine--1-D-myo-inosityl 2-amino-2-deoxy-alpha-D-glucopyranoside ligase [Arthrobacter sp. STN4]
MKTWKSRPVPELPGTMPELFLHETSANRVTALPSGDQASLYVCGITPYDATHMGHAATYVAFDLLNRAWLDAGRSVSYVQNVTDVDDPLLERATRDGVDWRDLALEQTALFHADMEALNVVAPNQYIGAVEAIEWIVPQIEELVEDGLAYRVAGSGGEPDGDVYFDVAAASAATDRGGIDGPWWLGQVSGLTEEEMLPVFAERGGDPQRPGKKHALDALLWRVARDGEPQWDGATLGPGRPGWHIECTVIAQRFLPEPFTVQGGGSDLVFPHHEMGAGHAFALSHVPMARHYAHTGMVGLDGEKMSKSKGNLVLVSKLREQGVEPAAIRLAILANHYRSDWCWTDALLANAQRQLATWRKALEAAPEGTATALLGEIRAALAADLDAPRALAAVDHWAGQALAGEQQCCERDAALVSDAVEALLGVEL